MHFLFDDDAIFRIDGIDELYSTEIQDIYQEQYSDNYGGDSQGNPMGRNIFFEIHPRNSKKSKKIMIVFHGWIENTERKDFLEYEF